MFCKCVCGEEKKKIGLYMVDMICVYMALQCAGK